MPRRRAAAAQGVQPPQLPASIAPGVADGLSSTCVHMCGHVDRGGVAA